MHRELVRKFLEAQPQWLRNDVPYVRMPDSDEPEPCLSTAAMKAFLTWSEQQGVVGKPEKIPGFLKFMGDLPEIHRAHAIGLCNMMAPLGLLFSRGIEAAAQSQEMPSAPVGRVAMLQRIMYALAPVPTPDLPMFASLVEIAAKLRGASWPPCMPRGMGGPFSPAPSHREMLTMKPPDDRSHRPRRHIRMDAGLDAKTREKLEDLAAGFHRSRAAGHSGGHCADLLLHGRGVPRACHHLREKPKAL
jgi:hypothetical protein